MKQFDVLVTLSTTASATIRAQADDKKEAADKALEIARQGGGDFELNEGNHRYFDDVYLGSGVEDDVEEIEVDAKEAGSNPSTNQNLAKLLFEEVSDSFETIYGIVEVYGAGTLVDLWWLAHVLTEGKGASIAQTFDSKLADLVRQLPSADLFLAYIDSEFLTNPGEI